MKYGTHHDTKRDLHAQCDPLQALLSLAHYREGGVKEVYCKGGLGQLLYIRVCVVL